MATIKLNPPKWVKEKAEQQLSMVPLWVERLNDLLAEVSTASVSNFSEPTVQGGPLPDPTGQAVEQLEDDWEFRSLLHDIQSLHRWWDNLSDSERVIVAMKYWQDANTHDIIDALPFERDRYYQVRRHILGKYGTFKGWWRP